MKKVDVHLDTFLHIRLTRMNKKQLNAWFTKNNLILEDGRKLIKKVVKPRKNKV